MQKKRVANNLLNKLHRGVVYTCIGVTLSGSFMIGMKVYEYYTVIKPELKKTQLRKIVEDSPDQAKELKL